MRGVVRADERSGPGRREEWSMEMKGVVLSDVWSGLVDGRSGPIR